MSNTPAQRAAERILMNLEQIDGNANLSASVMQDSEEYEFQWCRDVSAIIEAEYSAEQRIVEAAKAYVAAYEAYVEAMESGGSTEPFAVMADALAALAAAVKEESE